ncbi:hypothetical protein TCE0_044f16672 [Talaromyces pinophilus]|uniref:Reverse transcriptase n=1 Tax=Talaromyces pinophilus TaxID=128442 RepID=A0A478ED90_TALPI|nr:hypothetical protein TCE0_044f16672 [Talaromyces pinophilus]
MDNVESRTSTREAMLIERTKNLIEKEWITSFSDPAYATAKKFLANHGLANNKAITADFLRDLQQLIAKAELASQKDTELLKLRRENSQLMTEIFRTRAGSESYGSNQSHQSQHSPVYSAQQGVSAPPSYPPSRNEVSRPGIEGNEQADQAAKRAAVKPVGPGFDGRLLAYVRRACTEARRKAIEDWARENVVQGAHRRGRAYKMRRGWGLDKVAAKAPKRLTSRYYQLKTGHAPIGAYLYRIKARDSPECKACGGLRETVSHVLFECRSRHKARKELYRGFVKAEVPLPTAAEDRAAEDSPEARFFSEPRAAAALLQFVGNADLFRDKERAAKEAELGGHWGMDRGMSA